MKGNMKSPGGEDGGNPRRDSPADPDAACPETDARSTQPPTPLSGNRAGDQNRVSGMHYRRAKRASHIMDVWSLHVTDMLFPPTICPQGPWDVDPKVSKG